jgi:hypothetical protein
MDPNDINPWIGNYGEQNETHATFSQVKICVLDTIYKGNWGIHYYVLIEDAHKIVSPIRITQSCRQKDK